MMYVSILKGNYTMVDLEITDSFLPSLPKLLFPEGKVKFHVVVLMIGKVASEKKLVRLYSWEMYGIYGK